MENLVTNNFVDLILDTENQLIKLKWKGDVEDEDYRALWDTLLETGKKYNIRSLIIDQRNLGNVSMNIRIWLLINWIPKAKKEMENKLHVAIIVSEKLLNKSGMQYLVSGIKKVTSFNIEFVDTEDEAIKWLAIQTPQQSNEKAA